MADFSAIPYVLGIDLGVQSVGWAVIDLDAKGRPFGVRRSGVRCFDSGVGSETEISAGKDESGNVKRRQMRLQRRQLWRRARRQAKVFHLLQEAGLLPDDPARTPDERHQLLLMLDARLASEFLPPNDRIASHLLPYRLRCLALDQPLPPHALGRALYHLAQRRGFLSNRKSAGKRDEEEGDVKAAIGELARDMETAGARTLGEYLAGLDPEAEKQRIRKRWTGRQMYLDEFEKIWSAQSPHHAQLTDEWKLRIHGAIFHQRPLKPQKGLVGICDLEPGCRRAPRAALEAQRFRCLQKVNDLEISTPDGEIWILNEPEHADLRNRLIELLETRADVEFKSLRSKLGLKKPKGAETDYQFNLEAGGEKKLKGNATAAKLRKVLGDEFEKFSQEQLTSIVDDLIAYEKKDALAKRLAARYGIDPQKAAELAEVTLEDGYASLSREALRKLLPRMEEGMRFATAKEHIYGDLVGRMELRDLLPPVNDAVPQLRNPVVCRGLTELRKVVNALVRQYGKPDSVHVELARDLKRSRDKREEITKQNRQNEKTRDEAKRKLLERIGSGEPRPSDILKVVLADECNWECPYTGKTICMEFLVGPSPQFDIEHIIPFSRSLDNSFHNKTLCDVKENRDVKQNRTPYETYASNEQRWAEIVARVKRFRGSSAHAKLRKFQQKELEGDWAARQLQDTRYMSKLAAQYLGLLFGGQIDAKHRRRVQVSAGGVTAYLRGEWNLNAILADGGDEKNRGDHRHHAVDAVCIALTDAGTVKQLSDSACRAELLGHRLFVPVGSPWPSFADEVRMSIETINISYRVNRRVSGALHEDTNYSRPQKGRDKKGKAVEYRHVRKMLSAMTPGMIDAIVDQAIRNIVKKKVSDMGGYRKGMFSEDATHPYMTTNDGRLVPIHKARVRTNVAVRQVGKDSATRYVTTKINHHIEIVAVLDENGRDKSWEGHIVDLLEAVRRARARPTEEVIRKDHGAGREFRFSLAKNEFVEMEYEPGERRLYRVVGISEGDIEFHLHTDARPTMMKGRARVRGSPARIFKANARKVVVDPLGNILPAND